TAIAKTIIAETTIIKTLERLNIKSNPPKLMDHKGDSCSIFSPLFTILIIQSRFLSDLNMINTYAIISPTKIPIISTIIGYLSQKQHATIVTRYLTQFPVDNCNDSAFFARLR